MVFLEDFIYNRKSVNIVGGTSNFRDYLSHLFLSFKMLLICFSPSEYFSDPIWVCRILYRALLTLFKPKSAYRKAGTTSGSMLISKLKKTSRGGSERGTVPRFCWLFCSTSDDRQRFWERLTYFVHWH